FPYGPDDWFARNGDGDTVEVVERATKKVVKKLPGDRSTIHESRFSDDGKRMVLVLGTDKVRVWDVDKGKELSRPTDLFGSQVQITPDGRRLVGRDSKGGMGIWDAENGTRLVTLANAHWEYGFTLQPRRFGLSPDGRWLAVRLPFPENETPRRQRRVQPLQ